MGQVHRGRAQGLQRVKRVRAGAVLWILLMMGIVAGAQEIPDAPAPVQTPVVQSNFAGD